MTFPSVAEPFRHHFALTGTRTLQRPGACRAQEGITRRPGQHPGCGSCINRPIDTIKRAMSAPRDDTRTTTLLLMRLHDASDRSVWNTVDERYRPILIAVARRLGLTADEAEDAAQSALSTFAEEYLQGRYDREKGRLRAWLISRMRYRVADTHRRRAQQQVECGDSAIAALPDEDDVASAFLQERRHTLLALAMERLRGASRADPRSLDAFELHVLRGVSATEVARQLDMKPNDLYMVKHRLLAHLRRIVDELEGIYDDA